MHLSHVGTTLTMVFELHLIEKGNYGSNNEQGGLGA